MGWLRAREGEGVCVATSRWLLKEQLRSSTGVRYLGTSMALEHTAGERAAELWPTAPRRHRRAACPRVRKQPAANHPHLYSVYMGRLDAHCCILNWLVIGSHPHPHHYSVYMGRLVTPWALVALAAVAEAAYPFQNTSLPWAARVVDLVGRLTLDEKIAQLQHGGAAQLTPTPAITRLGIKYVSCMCPLAPRNMLLCSGCSSGASRAGGQGRLSGALNA